MKQTCQTTEATQEQLAVNTTGNREEAACAGARRHRKSNVPTPQSRPPTEGETAPPSEVANDGNDDDTQPHSRTPCSGSREDTPPGKVEEVQIRSKGSNSKLLVELNQCFNRLASCGAKIKKDDFQQVFCFRNPFMADRFFAMFDPDGDGCVEKDVLVKGLVDLTESSASQKLKFLFDMIDVHSRGHLKAEQLRTLLCCCMEESCLKMSEDDVEDMTMTLLESAGKGETEAITFDELLQLLQKHPGIAENLTFIMPARLPVGSSSKQHKNRSRPFPLDKRYLQNNVSYSAFMIAYILINVGLFVLSAVRYRTSNWCLIIARGCGMCLNFNSAFIVVPMLRYSLTWVRTTRLASLLPLDHTVYIHKVVGIVIVLQGSVHTLAHLGNLGYVVSEPAENGTETLKYWEYLFTTKPRPDMRDWACVTGVALCVILGVMAAFSMPSVRRSGRFEVFYWLHKLYIPFWVVTLLHGPIFWMFFLLPGLAFVVETITHSHFISMMTNRGLTTVKRFHVLPSKVTHLEIERPKGFRYRPGDYIFINIPGITRVEWHPFTISSAPEMEGTLWLHIRSLGNWTNRVYEHFESLHVGEHFRIVSENGATRITYPVISPEANTAQEDGNHGGCSEETEERDYDDCDGFKPGLWRRALTSFRHKQKPCEVKVLIDGPYGTPTRDIFDTEHAVLVATGIGVTPFASILQSIMYRYKASKNTCPQCDHRWYGDIPDTIMKLKKVDFIWVNRDQKCFEWFVSMLAQLEVEQAEEGSFENFLDLHLYMTSAVSKNDMKGLGLQLALELMYMKKRKDLVTGLRTRAQPGRPDWKKVFTKINETKKGKVKVFFCGANAIGQILKQHCAQFNFSFSKETF